MLDRRNRLVSGDDYRLVSRRGRKVSSPGGVIAVLGHSDDPTVRFGFIVSRAVGSAVTRNLVKRRLREAAKALLAEGVMGCDVVVRAHPGADSLAVGQWHHEMGRAIAQESRR